MTMIELRPPLKISARLLPAVKINGAWLSIEPTGSYDRRGAPEWCFYLDLPDGTEHTGAELHGWGDCHEMLETLLTFLSACAESRGYPNGENADLFSEEVGAWAEENDDEIGLAALEISEGTV